ncbi:hypothetical protein D8674_013346 [Pyrus ussuriensis x Pyrus communis]|uniref:Uncharacterized protein n=1 Tax=Pyrus ussuriensis x Pyrus communis TaxID=2448454 RepID=A0A5N5GQR1_9ROSA|nr:hypothetical protein D8674_013346 [Pyrus ussuriensis x Pyrus communis]
MRYKLALPDNQCLVGFSNVGEIDDYERAVEGLAYEESNNASAKSDPGSGKHPQASLWKDMEGEDSGKELSDKDDSKAVEDVDLDEADRFLNDDVQVEVGDTEASVEEWASWHEALGKLKYSIANEAKVLNSMKELIILGEAFSSRVDFRGVKVCSGLAEVLGRFFKHASDADHRRLCWRDMISDVVALGVPVGFLVEKLGELRDTMFRLRLEKEKGVLDQFIKVNKLMRALELQCKELEVEKLKLKELVRGSSKEITAYP